MSAVVDGGVEWNNALGCRARVRSRSDTADRAQPRGRSCL